MSPKENLIIRMNIGLKVDVLFVTFGFGKCKMKKIIVRMSDEWREVNFRE